MLTIWWGTCNYTRIFSTLSVRAWGGHTKIGIPAFAFLVLLCGTQSTVHLHLLVWISYIHTYIHTRIQVQYETINCYQLTLCGSQHLTGIIHKINLPILQKTLSYKIKYCYLSMPLTVQWNDQDIRPNHFASTLQHNTSCLTKLVHRTHHRLLTRAHTGMPNMYTTLPLFHTYVPCA